MRITESEIDRVAEELGLDRVQAFRHCQGRKLAYAEFMRKRAALTVRALPTRPGCLDSPPGPPATFPRLER